MKARESILCDGDKTELELRLGHRFGNGNLLATALTHSSWANEAGHPGAHNERLEFLGDAVLELCVSSELFRRFPEAREGDLTRMRAHLVSTPSLAALACELGIDRAILLGRGEESQGGRQRENILADAVEAVLAAVYEDGGFAAAQMAVARVFAARWPDAPEKPQANNAKSQLQELTQRLFRACPGYALVGASGPEHARIFEIRLTLPDGREFFARNTSCKKAEQDAAAHALQALNEP